MCKAAMSFLHVVLIPVFSISEFVRIIRILLDLICGSVHAFGNLHPLCDFFMVLCFPRGIKPMSCSFSFKRAYDHNTCIFNTLLWYAFPAHIMCLCSHSMLLNFCPHGKVNITYVIHLKVAPWRMTEKTNMH